MNQKYILTAFILLTLVTSSFANKNFLDFLEELDAANIKKSKFEKHQVKRSPRQNAGSLPSFVSIARANGAGCYVNSDEETDCLFPNPANLLNGYNQISASGINFEENEIFNNVGIKYIAFDPKKVVLRTAFTAVYNFYLNILDRKIMAISDPTCRDKPNNCPIQPEFECEMSDCLEVPKVYFKNLINVELLNQYKSLAITAAAKANWKNILTELEKFVIKIKEEIATPKCKSLTEAQIMSIAVKKSGTAAAPDQVQDFTLAQADNALKSC